MALIGAVWRYESPAGSPISSLLLDFTLIGVAIVVVDLAAAGIGAALMYMMAIPVVFLPWQRAVPVVAYGIAWSVVGLSAGSMTGPPTEVPEIVVTGIAVVAFGGLTLALLGVMAYRLESSYREGDRRARLDEVLARCGEVLLANPEERAIDAALASLLDKQAVPHGEGLAVRSSPRNRKNPHGALPGRSMTDNPHPRAAFRRRRSRNRP